MIERWAEIVRRELALIVAGLALVVFAGVAVAYYAESTAPGAAELFGHDYISFHTAGVLANTGDAVGAWDHDRHFAAQKAVVAGITGNAAPSYYYFGYPPTFQLLMMPFARLPYVASFLAFMTATGALFLAGVAAIAPNWRTPVLAAAVPVVLLTFIYGQNAWATAGVAALGLVLLPTRPLLSGLLIGLLTVKPQLGLAYPLVFLAIGSGRAILGAVVSACGLALASVAVLGPEAWRAFFAAATRTQDVLLTNSQVGFGRIQSTYSAARLLGAAPELAYGLQAVVTLAMAVLLVLVWRSRADYPAKAALACCATLVMSPFVLPYDLTLLVPAGAFLMMSGDGRNPAREALLLAAALALLPAILWRPDSGVLFGLPVLGLMTGLALHAARTGPARK